MSTSYDHLIRFRVSTHLIGADMRARLEDDRGEGVISAAIAVLIMAFLGAAMWVAFNGIWQNLLQKTTDSVNQIGPTGNGP